MIAKTLSRCSPLTAHRIRLATTQKGLRNMTVHLCCPYRTKQVALCFHQLSGRRGSFLSATLFSAVKSLRGNTMGQIFVNDVGYRHFKPMKAKSEAGNALLEFFQDVGVL